MDLVSIIKNLLLYGSLLFGLVLLTSFIIERLKNKRAKINEERKPTSNLIQRAKIISNLSTYSNNHQYFTGSYDYTMQNSKELKFLIDANQDNQVYFRNNSQSNQYTSLRSSNNRPRYTIVNEIMKENSKDFNKIYLDNYSASA